MLSFYDFQRSTYFILKMMSFSFIIMIGGKFLVT